MNTKNMLAWGGIVMGVLIILTQAMNLNAYLQYLWAALVIIASIWAMIAK